MPLWGNTDDAANSVTYVLSQVGVAANSDNRTALFGNTTASAFIAGATVGQFAVDPTEIVVQNGGVISYTITNNGSGYTANAAVTLSGGGGTGATSNATANATGRIASVNANQVGSSYETSPSVTIAAPADVTFNANTAVYKDATFNAATGVANTTEFITTTSAHGFTNGDKVQYLVAASNTAIGGLTNAASYYITNANTTAFTLSATSGGANVDVTATATSETGHTLRRVGQGYITIASNVFQVDDYITYKVAASNTALTGLANATQYYVVTSNSTTISVSTEKGGAAIVLTPGVSETGHSFTGQTATAVAVVGGGQNKGVTAGWNLRTVGTGGRAGRVRNECLVAMRSISTDASDDTVLPDA